MTGDHLVRTPLAAYADPRPGIIRQLIDPAVTPADVEWAQSEARRFEFPLGGRRRAYTCDVWVQKADGSIEIVELKRDERDLDNEDYRLTLAGVAEICRRCGWTFKIVLTREIFASRHHRQNVELFQSRRFARVGPEHLRRLDDFAFLHGEESTYGELAAALEPEFVPAGKAVLQALLVRRRINIDLTQPLYDETPVQII